MRKIKYKKGRKVHPSTLEYTGSHKDTPTEIQLFVYNADDVTEIQQLHVDEIQDAIDTSKVNWLNIHGLNEPEIIAKIGSNSFANMSKKITSFFLKRQQNIVFQNKTNLFVINII